jgi:lipopolysaccharide export system permease protein
MSFPRRGIPIVSGQEKPGGIVGVSRFDRYLLSQLVALFGFFALILVSVYWVNRAVGLFDRLLGDGHSALVFLEFSLLMLPNVIRLVLPIAAFASAIYITNRLTQESELVVMQATGFSAFRLGRPVLYFGAIVTALHLVLMNVLVPWSGAMLAEREAALSENVTARYLNAGQFMHPAAGVTLYIREITPQGELRDLFLADDRGAVERTTYTARRALLARGETGPTLLMFDGIAQTIGKDAARSLSITRFADVTYDLGGMLDRGGGALVPVDYMTTPEILRSGLTVVQAQSGAERAAILQEVHVRVAQPFLSLAAALVGFATLLVGAFSRFGLWRQILVAVGILIFLQLLNTSGAAAALRDARLWPAVYAAPLAGIGIAALLLHLAQRPRRMRRALA